MKSLSLLFLMLLLTINVEAQSVVISESTLVTTEGQSAVLYFISLSEVPGMGETVTVTPASSDPTEGTVSAAVSFTSSDWNQPQSVTVTPGSSGDGNDGDVMYDINHSVMSTGGTYTGVMAPSITVTNINIDGVSIIIVDPRSAIIVDEEGTTTQIVTFSTSTSPTSDITIPLVNNNPAEITLSAPSVVLTAGNGYTSTVTITGVLDMIEEGTIPFSVTASPAMSADQSYDGLSPGDINGSVTELPVVVAPIPTIGQWGLIVLFLSLSICAIVALTEKKHSFLRA